MGNKKTGKMTIPRVLIAGTRRNVGTSTFVLGLLVCLKRSGVSTAVGKIGPSLADATRYRRVSGRLAHTIDFWLLGRENVTHSLGRLGAGAELLLIHGDQGIYDNYPGDFSYEQLAQLADELELPMILVVDGYGYGESIAALVRGFASDTRGARLAGIVANRVRDDEHNQCLKRAVESINGPRYLGGIPVGDTRLLAGPPPDSGMVNPTHFTRSSLIAVGDLVQGALDLEELLAIASNSRDLEVPQEVIGGKKRSCRIAVADDAAFHLTVQDNLDLMRRAGAEIVAFSPLADIRLPPKTGGIYLPNGYIDLYAADLQGNKSMLSAIRQFAEQGGVLYAEGNSLAYLCQALVLLNRERYEMVGLIPGTANATADVSQRLELQYCEVITQEQNIISGAEEKFRALRDSRWLISFDSTVLSCFQVLDRVYPADPSGSLHPRDDGFSPSPHVLATSLIAHWGSNPRLAETFVGSVTAAVPTIESYR